MRKKVVTMLSIVAAMGMVAGCGSNSSSGNASNSNQKITLTMWQQWGGGHEEDELKGVIKQYEQLHPNITINEIPVTDNSKILTAISGGNPPDIIDLGSSSVIGEWASKGALTDLGPYIQNDKSFNKNNFVSSAWQAVSYNGKTYGLPFDNFDVGLVYNKSLFKAAGLKYPPTTLEELTKDAMELTKVGPNGQISQMGFLPDYPGASNGQVVSLEDFGWLFGGQWYNSSTGKPEANSPQNIAALQWESQFYSKFGPQKVADFEKSAGAYLSAQDPFESGKLAMVYDGAWELAYIKQNNPALYANIGVAPFPAPASQSSLTGTTFIDTNPQVIPAGAPHAQAAWDFISWETTDPQVTAQFCTTVPGAPQIKNVTNFSLASDPLYGTFINEAGSQNAHPWPQTSVSEEYVTKLSQAENDVLMGKQSAADALNALQASISGSLGN